MSGDQSRKNFGGGEADRKDWSETDALFFFSLAPVYQDIVNLVIILCPYLHFLSTGIVAFVNRSNRRHVVASQVDRARNAGGDASAVVGGGDVPGMGPQFARRGKLVGGGHIFRVVRRRRRLQLLLPRHVRLARLFRHQMDEAQAEATLADKPRTHGYYLRQDKHDRGGQHGCTARGVRDVT